MTPGARFPPADKAITDPEQPGLEKVCREGRRIMIKELGLEPGAQLRALHRHILADAGALRPIAAPWRPVRAG
jgi:hypothetical protein